MRFSGRKWLAAASLALVLSCGFMVVAWLPGEVEGVYNPLSSCGCVCDQFMEWREGRVIVHVMETEPSVCVFRYERNAKGVIEVRTVGDPGLAECMAVAEPHLLLTVFRYPKSGTTDWRWKRWGSAAMREKMENSRIRVLERQTDGTRDSLLNARFDVIRSTFKPYKADSPH